MEIKIQAILDFLNKACIAYEFIGDENSTIYGYSPLNNLQNSTVTWIRSIEKYSLMELTKYNNVLVIANKYDVSSCSGCNFIFTDNPHRLFFKIISNFFKEEELPNSIALTSVVETTQIGREVSIGHHCYIGKAVVIKDGVIIKHNVTISGKVSIGENCVIESGTAIGMNGFGFYKEDDGSYTRVPHLGGISIGKNVEIGANTCIDRGCLSDTVISDGVKIDNECHIAHNVFIGENTLVIACSMIAGSSDIGKNVWLSPNTIVKNQVHIGDGAFTGIGSVVLRDVEDNHFVTGNPARTFK